MHHKRKRDPGDMQNYNSHLEKGGSQATRCSKNIQTCLRVRISQHACRDHLCEVRASITAAKSVCNAAPVPVAWGLLGCLDDQLVNVSNSDGGISQNVWNGSAPGDGHSFVVASQSRAAIRYACLERLFNPAAHSYLHFDGHTTDQAVEVWSL